MLGRLGFLSKTGFVGIAVMFAAIGAHTLNPRQLFHEMYPLEPVKQDAFHICGQSDPTFVRAVGADREGCYNKMPHVMAVAMGRVKPTGTPTMQAMIDPAREVELLMLLAATPPRQPITVPRSFSNTAWLRALTPPCDDKHSMSPLAAAMPSAAASAGDGSTPALAGVTRHEPLPLASAIPAASDPTRGRMPVIPLSLDNPATAGTAGGDHAAGFNPLPAPDIGDRAAPAIVPLAPMTSCGA
ncbi:MAG TPA: hypothetical protein VMI30_00390 [Stellaceae bacterium]|nr:hypothetical protein [Stellaceae bacterium]